MRRIYFHTLLLWFLPSIWLQTSVFADDALPPFSLGWPVDCTLGETCWIARYPDKYTDSTPMDYTCGVRTQEGHDGTDIAFSDLSALAADIPVRAAADGVVWRVRDGVEDQILKPGDENTVSKIGCGNVVILQHPGGWQTNYCHMKNGSVSVEPGQSIAKGTQVGVIGVSGLTEFPHLHFMVRRAHEGGKVSVDPFDGQPLTEGCNVNNRKNGGLWNVPIDYQETALLPPLVTEKRADRATMWQPQPSRVNANTRVLYFQARGFHVQEGDTWRLQLTAPDGSLFRDREETQYKSQQRITIALGVARPEGGFKSGEWSATVSLFRDGILLSEQTTLFDVRAE